MKTNILVIVALVVSLVVGLAGSTPARAQRALASPRAIPPDEPAVYVANLDGQVGWDVTPGLIQTIFSDADRVFGDLVRVPDAKKGEADRVVQSEAWKNHVVVMRLDLTTDPRLDDSVLPELVSSLRRAFREQLDLRNRRVVLWVRRAIDAPALVIPEVPEIVLVPGAQVSISEELADVLSRAKGEAPETPSVEGYPMCATHAEMLGALALPEETPVLFGDGQKIIDRWAQFRDRAMELGQAAVGPEWEAYVRVVDDPDAARYERIRARRDILQQLRRAYTHLQRYEDLAGHPAFVPLRDRILEKVKIVSESPEP